MKNYQTIIITLYFVFSMLSCNRNNDQIYEKNSMADSTANGIVSSSAAIVTNKDSTRKFIRMADLKFKVESVIQSTYDIEETTIRHGGFVTFTNLTSEINNHSTRAVSIDSSLETTYYTVANSIIIRVPNTKLDTTLKEISKNVKYLDYRIIKAEDVALQMLSNKQAQTRYAYNQKRITNAIDNRGKKLNETTIAEDMLLSKQEQNDNAAISNLSLTDKINFSTINLSIYQPQTIQRTLVLNEKNINEYEPGFGCKMMESFEYGWNMLATFLVFLAKLWGLFLLSILIYFVYKLRHRLFRIE